jgi:Glycosyl hydrolase catalytic core
VLRKLCRALGAALLTVLVAAGSAGASTERPRFLGVVASTELGEPEFAVMREGGVRTYRLAISWPSVQRSRGAPLDWTASDRLVRGLVENEIEPLPVVYGTPCFVVPCDAGDRGQPSPRPPLGSGPAKLAWAAFLNEIVGRYGPGGSFWRDNPSVPRRPLRVWEIWNEPNVPQFYAPEPSVDGYVELLQISARAITMADPGATILVGGLAGDPDKPRATPGPRFLDGLYRTGARPHFDAIAVHPYAPHLAGVRSQLDAFREVLASHHDRETPIWVTELGWGATRSGEGRLVETIVGQAEMLRTAFGLLSAKREEWNIARALWYSWRDPPPGQPACSWCRSAGLFDAAGDPRPSWHAFTALSTTGDRPLGPEVELPDAPEVDDGGNDTPPRWVVVVAALALCLVAGALLLLRRSRARRPR